MDNLKEMKVRFNTAKIALGAGFLSLAISAQAALPESIKTEVATAKADVTEAMGMVLGVAVLFFGFRMIKRLF